MDAQYDGGPNNSTHPSIGIDDKALFTVLLSETVLRALQREYFTIEDMHGYEPSLMFAIPRLSVVYGLLYAPEYLGLTETHVAIRWLRDVSGSKVKLLHEIQSDLRNLTEDEVHALERMITVESSVSSSDVDDLAATPALRDVYRAIAAIADDMQTGARAKEFVGILGQLFEMYSNKQEDDGSAEGTVEQARVSVEQSMQVAQRHRSTSKNPLRHLFLAVTGRLRSQSTEDETPAVASR